MSSTKEIKRKITSIKNTGKITKAMELISTVKMKKAQDLVLEKKDFVFEMLKIFLRVEKHLSDFPIFNEGKGKKTLAVIITSNKGLCGGYNINVMKKVSNYIKETGEELEFISLGKRGAQFVAKTGNKLLADFSEEFSDNIEPIFAMKISKLMKEEFLSGNYKKVVVFYNYYVNTIKQVPSAKVTLPVKQDSLKVYLEKIAGQFFDLEEEKKKIDGIHGYAVEPSVSKVADEVLPIILNMMFFDTILEAKASEHSSRMIAMKNAKDSANKIADKLTLSYNKARQAAITREVSEITAGVESMKDL
ncbi:ATP synthase F1 subunit gamma [Candidatus Gracilibacteria bacterium]|nr:MAG: ATP synthase F1 subunit gamma [Candidatus Gracilibacteria bacterium]PIE85694.1 MAG: ATP synthase F1 subunit gamma [Candidatus Gracilibacteria bacterium]